MGVLEYVERLRREPEAKRRQVTFWWAAGLTLLIAIIWLSTWRHMTPVASDNQTITSSSTPLGTNSGPGSQPGIWSRIKLGWQTITQ